MGLLNRRRNKVKKLSGKLSQPKKSKRGNNQSKKKIKKHVEFIREVWDDNKSIRSNFDNMGLAINPNESIDIKNLNIDDSQIEKELEEVEELKVNLEAFEEPKEKKQFYAKTEKRYWERLIRAYREDYKAMERDIKLNYYQHTKKKCEKKCKLYIELYGSPI